MKLYLFNPNFQNLFNWYDMTKIRLMHRDNMEFMASIPDKFYELAIVDPPYFKGVAKENFYGLKRKTKKKKSSKVWDVNIPTIEYYNEVVRVSKNQIIWGINYFNFGFIGPGRIIWDKKNDASTFSKAEIASCSLIESVQMFRWLWNGMLQENMSNKFICDHPSPKPPELYKFCLSKFATKGDKILDTHGGSMSIAIACADYGFDLDLCELDADYYKDGVNRVKNHLKQSKMFGTEIELILT